MDGLRAKITPEVLPGGGVRVRVEWVLVVGNAVEDVQGVEEFAVGPDKAGWAYVTRAVFPGDGALEPGTFFLDPAGRRHFRLQAEAGAVGMAGCEVAMTPERGGE